MKEFWKSVHIKKAIDLLFIAWSEVKKAWKPLFPTAVPSNDSPIEIPVLLNLDNRNSSGSSYNNNSSNSNLELVTIEANLQAIANDHLYYFKAKIELPVLPILNCNFSVDLISLFQLISVCEGKASPNLTVWVRSILVVVVVDVF